MATTTITNTGGIANSLNTPARADEDDVSVDCGTIGSSYEEEYIQVYRERILVGGSFFPPDNSESGSGRSEWNGMLHDISSLFPATKSETDSSSLFSRSISNSIKAIFPPHRSIDDNGMLLDISSLFPATKSETDSSSLLSRPNSNSIMAIFPPRRSTDGSENEEIIRARNPSISSYFPAYFSDSPSSEKVILQWDPSSLNWEDSGDKADECLSAIDEILNLRDELSVRSNSEIVDRAYSAIQHAMYRLEDEFRHVSIRNTVPFDKERLYGIRLRRRIPFAFKTAGIIAHKYDDEIGGEFESFLEDVRSSSFHKRRLSLNDNALVEFREIATRMIRSGFEKKCIQVYSTVRCDALDECLVILGIEKLSIEEVQKIEWNLLNLKMGKWIQAVKIVVRLILSDEKSLCDEIFYGADETQEICFNETVKGCVMQLLNFGKAVAIGRRSHKKLFRILDMYEVMAEALATLEVLVTDDVVINGARDVLSGLGEAACGTFAEFENAVQSQTSEKPMQSGEIHPLTRYVINYGKKPMQSGEIHPLTRYVMNYVKLIADDYSETLNFLLEIREDDDQLEPLRNDDSDSSKLTPVARRLLVLITSLHSNLEEKSKLYEDGALQYFFLMNNILYVAQKVKGSDLNGLLGDNWLQKLIGQFRQYGTSYLRASWSKVLHCLKDEGIGGSSSNASRVDLKERFKNFNAWFEEIYRVQTAWKVPDAQPREDLRISISEKVIPAYRSFMGRLVKRGRHNYIKYTADYLESYLFKLFEGVPRVLHRSRRHRRRRKSTKDKGGLLRASWKRLFLFNVA